MKKPLMEAELGTELDDLDESREGVHLLSVADAIDEYEDEEDDEFEDEDKLELFDVEAHAKSVLVILKPVSLCMALVVFMVRLIQRKTVNVR